MGAIAIWIIGRWLIGMAVRLISSSLERQKVDITLARYMGTIVSGTLTVILIVAILGFFGVETTSFAAIVAAAGIAIGMAWSGLLANFAAGAFMMILRPIKVGDDVTAGGVTGTVKEIGIFATAINTPDNVLTMVGNNKIFGDTIHNFSANPYRRVDLKAQLTDAADYNSELNGTGPCLLVRPYCHNAHYWQVHADTNQAIKQTMIDGKFPGPVGEMIVHNRN